VRRKRHADNKQKDKKMQDNEKEKERNVVYVLSELEILELSTQCCCPCSALSENVP
jgi:hypothetical protein